MVQPFTLRNNYQLGNRFLNVFFMKDLKNTEVSNCGIDQVRVDFQQNEIGEVFYFCFLVVQMFQSDWWKGHSSERDLDVPLQNVSYHVYRIFLNFFDLILLDDAGEEIFRLFRIGVSFQVIRRQLNGELPTNLINVSLSFARISSAKLKMSFF